MGSLTRFFSEVGIRRPGGSLAFVAVATLVLATGLSRLRLESAIEKTLPEDSVARQADRAVRTTFDARPVVVIGIVSDDGAFNSRTLLKLKRLTRVLEELTLVEGGAAEHAVLAGRRLSPELRSRLQEALRRGITRENWPAIEADLAARASKDGSESVGRVVQEVRLRLYPFDDVISLTSVDAIEATTDGLLVGPVLDEVPVGRAELDSLRRRVMSDRLLRGRLVSEDATTVAVLATLSFDHGERPDLAGEVTAAVRTAARTFEGPERVFVSGVPVVNILTAEAMEGDLSRLVPIVVLVLALVLFLSFRRWLPTLLPLVVVLVALVWTLGAMGFAGRPITLVTTSLPVMLLAIGIADGIHLITHYSSRLAEGLDRRRALVQTVENLAMPVLMTSLTTAAGFGSLAIAALPTIRDFGIFTAFGTMVALVATLTVLPALIRVTGARARTRGPAATTVGVPRRLTDRAAVAIERVAGARPRVTLGVAALLVVSSLAVSSGLKVGSKMTGNFAKDSEIFRAGEILNQKLGGTQLLDIVIDTGRSDGAKDPAVLAWIRGLQDYLEQDSAVGKTLSMADLIERMNFVLHDENPAYDRLPLSRERVQDDDGRVTEVRGRAQVGQYLLLYENAGGGELDDVVDFDYRRLRVVTQVRGDDHTVSRAARDRALRYIDGSISPGPVQFGGCASLCVYVDDLIIPSQIRSLITALGLVTIMLAGMFRSVRLALAGVVPMVLTISLSFGGMWLLDVPLDSITALIASIVLGTGVDHAIHFLSWYRRQRLAGLTHEESLTHTRIHTARPILLNAVAVAVGFLVLTGSSFFPVRVIGGFVAATLVFSSVATLALMPALLGTRFVRKNWD